MATIEEALQTAVRHHQSGRLDQAEGIYLQILNVVPEQPAALSLLGALQLQKGSVSQAIQFLEQSIQLSPDDSGTLNNLGGAYQAAERWQDSILVLQRAIALAPENAKLHFDLGNAFKALNDHDQAISSFQQAVRLNPGFIQALNNLGTTFTAAGRTEEAVATLKTALALKPDYANARNGLGNAYLECGRVEEGIACLRTAIELQPKQPRFYCNLGVALKSIGDADGALQAYQSALQLQPDMLEVRRNLGNLFVSQQHSAEAIVEFRKAAELAPNDVDIRIAIGDAYRELEDFPNARQAYQTAVELRPKDSALRLKEAFLCPAVFSSQDQILAYRQQLSETLTDAAVCDFPLADIESRGQMPPFALSYQGLNDLKLRRNVARVFEECFRSLPAFDPPASEKPAIGFLVTNRHEGIFLRCMAGLIDRLNRDAFEVWILAPPAALLTIRNQLSNPDTHYLELPDRLHRMIDPIRTVGLHVLYFWECSTDLLNYFLPFARLAQVQCTGWGLPVTTGIPNMDFYLSESAVEPSNAHEHYSENLLLSGELLTWQQRIAPAAATKLRSDFGLCDSNHLYVCAQNLRKLHPDFDHVFAGILNTDPVGIVVLVEDRNPAITSALKNRVTESVGRLSNRIVFLPRVEFSDYLNLLQIVDVALDPLYYGAGITAYEMFSCGLPIITRPTEFRRGRYVAACYEQMQLDTFVAESDDDYIRLAVKVAADSDQYRAVIQQHTDVLFENPNAVTAFESLLFSMLKGC